jgi:hypothetical protein
MEVNTTSLLKVFIGAGAAVGLHVSVIELSQLSKKFR